MCVNEWSGHGLPANSGKQTEVLIHTHAAPHPSIANEHLGLAVQQQLTRTRRGMRQGNYQQRLAYPIICMGKRIDKSVRKYRLDWMPRMPKSYSGKLVSPGRRPAFPKHRAVHKLFQAALIQSLVLNTCMFIMHTQSICMQLDIQLYSRIRAANNQPSLTEIPWLGFRLPPRPKICATFFAAASTSWSTLSLLIVFSLRSVFTLSYILLSRLRPGVRSQSSVEVNDQLRKRNVLPLAEGELWV